MALEDRGKALEEEFFRKQEAQKLEAMRKAQSKEAAAKALAKASGMTDETVIARLVELDISAETVSAVSLVPLIMVAWADGQIQTEERDAILMAAKGKGIEEDSRAYELLESWMQKKPGDSLIEAWEAYIRALDEHLTPEQKKILRNQVVDRARHVAEAAGGFLGFQKVHSNEAKMLRRLEAAFASAE